MIKKFFNFVKNNVFLIFAAYWFISFVIGFITINPSTLDVTTRKIKALELGSDLLWSLVFMLEYTVTKVGNALDERIDFTNKRIDLIFNFMEEAAKLIESKEEESAEEEAVKEELAEEEDD